jgi:hypothetical protein
MGKIYGDGPIYAVHYFDGGHTRKHEAFEGEGCVTRADEFYEQMKQRADVEELWLVRLDGGEWKFVTDRIVRNAAGEWTAAASRGQ